MKVETCLDDLPWNLPGLNLDLEEREDGEDELVDEANGFFREKVTGKTTAIPIAEGENLNEEFPSRIVC